MKKLSIVAALLFAFATVSFGQDAAKPAAKPAAKKMDKKAAPAKKMDKKTTAAPATK